MRKLTLTLLVLSFSINFNYAFSSKEALKKIINEASIPKIDTIRLGPNEFRFQVDFSESSFPETPRGLILDDEMAQHTQQESPPRWIYFWDFGDGIYKRGKTVTHKYAESNKNYDVNVYMRAIYSADEEPELERVIVPIKDIPTPVNNTNFTPEESTKPIKFVPQWHAAQPGDEVVYALSYRNRQSIPIKGFLSLTLPSGIDFIRATGNFPSRPNKSTEQGSGNEVIQWDYNDLAVGEENTFFVILKVAENTPGESAPDEEATINASIRLGMVIEEDGGIDILGILGLNFYLKGPNDINTGNYADTNTDYVPVDEEESLRVNKARDPNSIIGNKSNLIEGERTHQIEYTVHFENNGTAPAKEIKVTSMLDSNLKIPSLNTDDSDYSPRNDDRIEFKIPDSAPTSNPVWILKLKNEDERGLLPSLEGFDVENLTVYPNRGYLKYQIETQGRLIAGEVIKAVAKIEMDDESLITDTFYTKVIPKWKFKLPWRFGLKFGFNHPDVNQDFKLLNRDAGFHAGLTLKKALGGMDANNLREQKLSINSYPRWYYQAELGVTRLKIQRPTDMNYDLWYADLNPLQIRWIPKMPLLIPDWNIFNFIPRLSNRRFLGFSAGYTASYLVRGDLNQGRLMLGDFSDRLEHGAFGDISVLNILGRPGISFGYRWTYRWAKIPDEKYHLGQIYIHLNL